MFGTAHLKGFVSLTSDPLYVDLANYSFPTASGKVELTSEAYGKGCGQNMLPPFTPPVAPPEGAYLPLGGLPCISSHTINNPLLLEQVPENTMWINNKKAKATGINPGDRVRARDAAGKSMSEAGVKIISAIHPEAIFVVHGFGHDLPCENRASTRAFLTARAYAARAWITTCASTNPTMPMIW